MIHSHSIDELSLQNAWLTIGIFDGVHLGHQQILRTLIAGAHQAGAPAVVLTFFPHPAIVLGGKKDFKYLTPPEERLHLLESLGVDVVITQTFDRTFADQPAYDFMHRVVQSLGLRSLIIGYDTALGRGREGDAACLTEIGKELNYTVQVIPALSDETGVISSTRIRVDIASGNVSAAAGALGRYYSISGQVIHGDGRGHRINVPTANLAVPDGKVIPAYGIYACWAWLEPSLKKKAEASGRDLQGNKMVGSSEKGPGTKHPSIQSASENSSPTDLGKPAQEGKKFLAAVNVGVRPTFTPDLPAPAIEAHLLDFKGDIYGQQLKLEFVEYLRPEEKFATVQSLVDQIRLDIDLTREILS
jgi:riboflavin kinase/FMN adenylyltransferase